MTADFLNSRVNYVCRFCDAGLHNRNDLNRNVLLHERYHHEIMTFRKKSFNIIEKIKRFVFFSQHELRSKFSILHIITFVLNIIMGCLPDPAHSEYYGIIRILYFFLYTKIFTVIVLTKFIKIFHRFFFSFEWGRIQSSTIHMKSWNMNECDRASIIISIMLRCWLQNHHLCSAFKIGLKNEFFDAYQKLSSEKNVTIWTFVKIVKNNMLISTFNMFFQNRKDFHQQIFEARYCFLHLMNVADINEKFKIKKTQKFRFSNEKLLSNFKSRSMSIVSSISFFFIIRWPFQNVYSQM